MAGTSGRPNGRPAHPPQIHALHGNASHLSKDELKRGVSGTMPDGIPTPPSDLKAAGRRAWDLYWKHGGQWLTETDRPTLEEICRILDEDADMRRVLRKEGLTIRDQWPKVLTSPDTLDLLTRMFEDEEKARLCLYQLKAIAEKVGDKKSRINPLLEASHRIRQRLVPLWIEAHLTPSSRGRANIAKEVHDPLKEWEASKTG